MTVLKSLDLEVWISLGARSKYLLKTPSEKTRRTTTAEKNEASDPSVTALQRFRPGSCCHKYEDEMKVAGETQEDPASCYQSHPPAQRTPASHTFSKCTKGIWPDCSSSDITHFMCRLSVYQTIASNWRGSDLRVLASVPLLTHHQVEEQFTNGPNLLASCHTCAVAHTCRISETHDHGHSASQGNPSSHLLAGNILRGKFKALRVERKQRLDPDQCGIRA